MRRLFVVGVLLTMMLGLSTLQAEGSGAADPLTLATIGFVVLAAFALAELGAALSLPKVTGYILAGITLGPFAGNIMSSSAVQEMRMFNELALGLIATTAGLELDLGGLRKLARTLTATIVLKIVLGILVVGGTLFAVESRFDVLGLASNAERMGIAIIFAALSLGTSPAIALAIISESKAKGRLSDIVLGAAIVKDVVVVVCLAIAVATARALTGGGALGADVLLHVGEELGASVLAGSILGGLLILYLRFVKAEMLLFVAAMVLVVAEVSEALHLELLLVFIVAGLIVRNFSRHEHDLLHPLETVSLPVFIVFFTNAGAGVDLAATLSVLPLALAVCGARVVAYIVAGNLGGKLGGETGPPRTLAWLAYLPQAGVTLGLIGLAAGQLDETIGPQIATLGMAVVAINLLAGPVTMGVALRRAGEIPTDDEEDDAAEAKPSETPLPESAAQLEDARLLAVVGGGLDAARAELGRWVEAVAAPPVERFYTHALQGLADLDSPSRIKHLLGDLASARGADAAVSASPLFAGLAARCRDLPDERQVALEAIHRDVQPDDGRLAAAGKRLANVAAFVTFRSDRRTRRVPVRLVARTVLEPRFVDVTAEAQAAVQRLELDVLRIIEDVATEAITTDEAVRAVQDRQSRGLAEVSRRADEQIAAAFDELAKTLAIVGTPRLRLAKVRYSSVEARVRSGLDGLDTDLEAWADRRAAAYTSTRVTAAVATAEQQTAKAVATKIVQPLEQAFLGSAEAVGALERRLEALHEKAPNVEPDRLEVEVRALFPKPASKAYRSALGDARRVPSGTALVEPLMPDLPEQATLLPDHREVATASRPASASLREMAIRERIHARIVQDLAEPLDAVVDDAQSRLDEIDKTIGDALALVEFLTRSVTEANKDEGKGKDEASTTSDAEARTAVADGCSQARTRLAPVAAQALDHIKQTTEAVTAALDRSYGSLSSLLLEGSAAATVHGETLAAPGMVARTRAAVTAPLRALWQRMVVAVRGEAARYAQRRQRRARAGHFTPADIREFLDQRAADADRGSPAVYEQLFSTDPLRDPVLFVAHREDLDALVRAERKWRGDTTAGNAVLVVGGSGSGKSSMVAIGRMKVGLRRSVIVERRAAGGGDSLLHELSRRIGCDAAPDAIAGALAEKKSLVAIDDVHTWIDDTPQGLAALQQLLAVIERTRTGAFWILSIDGHAFDVLDELVPLRGWFGQILALAPLEEDTLGAVVAARHRPFGAQLVYPPPQTTGLLPRLWRRNPDEAFHHQLRRHSGGVLRQAVRLWRAASRARGDTAVDLEPIAVDAAGLPFWPSLDFDALAMLSLLLRRGPQPLEAVATELGTEAGRAARFLVTAGLVRVRDDEYEVPVSLRDDAESALRAAGILREEDER